MKWMVSKTEFRKNKGGQENCPGQWKGMRLAVFPALFPVDNVAVGTLFLQAVGSFWLANIR